ncbi:ABC transporter permease [Helicobacter sp. 16-1353]|uniref:amino acid ABC transporter permease n=1 Tax=Helicobacter sp. 16-1353 TaxID=2004996 RepID=UPI000DCEF9E7|nr:amino acid ABC transporter permease [Helicobacter sp. 16-1353]RAX54378.1 ABC transporter permease [Helicobacter sp. 16-1353]
MQLFDFEYALSAIPAISKGVPLSLAIAIVGFIVGSIVGLILSLIRIYKIPVLFQLATIYISFFRGIPVLVQIFLAYYGIPLVIRYFNQKYGLDIDISNIGAIYFMYLVYSLYCSAYLSEIFRSAILSIDKGQLEASYSVGMTTAQSLILIILPQSLLLALPNILNFFIMLIKETSLVFAASVPEIMGVATLEADRSSKFLEVYIIAALFYWTISIVLEKIFAILEKRVTTYKKIVGAK